MQALIAGIVAAFVGIVVGFWLRGASTKAEIASAKSEKDLFEQRSREQTAEVIAVRDDLKKAQEQSGVRAGFESLAVERLSTISERDAQLQTANDALKIKNDEILRLSKLNEKLATDLANEQGNGERLTDQFKVLASEILKENSKTFTDQNKDSLSQLLNPLTVDLNKFRDKVEAVEKENLIGRTELKEQLKGLESLNKKLTDEAHNLSTALRRDTKAQGNWGEIILLDILENQGLRKGEHFTFQQSFIEEGNEGQAGQRRQTDVIVKLPEGRHLIIDSKVTLNAYYDYVKADNEADRQSALKRHLLSVRTHYTDLAGRNYSRLAGIQSPDFVVMFVPIEPAFMLAMQEDDGIWLDAYQKGVLFAGPTTVLFVIRIVENLWRQEQQGRNVKEVMRRGAALYDKFRGFAEDMESIGESLRSANKIYDRAQGKLATGPGNLIRQVEELKKLGVSPKKSLSLKMLEEAGVEETLLAIAAEAELNNE